MELEQLRQMVLSLGQQVQQHHVIFEDFQALKQEIENLKSANQALLDENEHLRAQLAAKNDAPVDPPPTLLLFPRNQKRSFAKNCCHAHQIEADPRSVSTGAP
jgi:regulator of replication initiation timing